MRAQNLPFLYTFENRRPLFSPPVLCIPTFYHEHESYRHLSLENLGYFPDNTGPLHVEFCSGNGIWIVEKARSLPHINFIAVEKQFQRVRKIWSKTQNLGIKNLLIVCADAKDWIQWYVPDHSLDKMYINFPDPWPKIRHAKHRLMTVDFVSTLKRKGKENMLMYFVTDHKEYLEETRKNLLHVDFGEVQIHRESLENYGRSYFGDLWLSHGKEIYFLQAKGKSHAAC